MQNPVTANTQKESSFLRYLQIVLIFALALYFGRKLFIPLFYGLFIAIVLYPVCKFLELKKVPKTIAIFICLIIVTLLIGSLFLLLLAEVKSFTENLPQLQNKAAASISQLQHWFLQQFNVSVLQQGDWIKNLSESFLQNMAYFLQATLTATVNTVYYALLVPVFTALFLYNRGTFIRVIRSVAGKEFAPKLNRILKVIIHTYHRYIRGMILVYIVVGILNTVGLLILGVKHALLFGMLTAIMTIIPYIGIIISALLPISVAWITTGSIWVPFGVVAVFGIVQYLEANVIFPFIVGVELNVNTWATLVAIIAGGIIWGVSGMILFMPFVALLKITSDNIEGWKPLNILISRNFKNSFKSIPGK
jgi:predicted PurR-regulated permease PerM